MATEAERQRAMLQALRAGPAQGPASPADSPPADALRWRAPQAGWQRGLQVYRANAGMSAERALAAAYPTVTALIGAESMAGLARVLWHAQPPVRGDLAEFGEGLAGFIAASDSLASEPYLADVAALDWQVHRAERAADAPAGVQQLERLGDTDPALLRLQLAPGTALLRSRWPIVAIWQAHRPRSADGAGDRFAEVRAAMAAGRGENALVWREGWPARVQAVSDEHAAFTQAVLAGQPLPQALDAAPDLDFAGWLGEALQRGRLSAVKVATAAAGESA